MPATGTSAPADTRADHRVVDDPPVVDGRWLFAPRAGARIGALSRVGGVTWDDRSSGDAKTLVEPPRHGVASDTRVPRLRAVVSLVACQALQCPVLDVPLCEAVQHCCSEPELLRAYVGTD
jgi:hypothetical protein